MKLVYLGTPAVAVLSLERAVEAGHEELAVFTQPDRPKGRGHQSAMPPVKQTAIRLGLTVQQPERIRRSEVVEQLRALAPEAMVVVGYGQIIPQTVIDSLDLGTMWSAWRASVHLPASPSVRRASRPRSRPGPT